MTIMLAYQNKGDGAVLSGGAWQPTMPLSRLQSTNLSYPARSADAALASTKFDVDLGAEGVVVRLFALMGHTCTQDALFRITAGNAPGAATFDSGWQSVWSAVYGPYDLDFEDDGWFLGRLSTADAALYPVKLIYDFGSNQLWRYYRIEFNDTANAAGFLEFTRLFMGPVWTPTYNYDWGAAIGFQPRDRSAVAISGARYVERKTPARVFKFTLGGLTDSEARGRFLDLQRLVGSEGEILVIPDPSDTANRHRLDVFCHVLQWGEGVNFAAYGINKASVIVEELL